MSNPNWNQYEKDQLKRSQTEGGGPAGAAARNPSSGERSAPARMAEEQQPIMRSVAISPHLRQPPTLLFEPALGRAEPSGPGGYARLRGISHPELVKSSLPKAAPPASALRAHGRSKSESSLSRKWHVDHASLAGRPLDFPLLPTNRTVFHAKADVISNRLSDCLAARSIRAKFSKREDNTVKCRNKDYCKFAVRLYAGDEGGVLVEVQRLSGDAVSFARDCRALLNAAEGKSDDETLEEVQPLYLRLPVSEMKFAKSASLPPPTKSEEAESVDACAGLLSSRASDANVLGMEGLAILTDSQKTMRSTAVLASQRILDSAHGGNENFNLHNCVMSPVVYGPSDDLPSDDEDACETTSALAAALEEHSSKLRNLALSSLSNALALLSDEGSLDSTLAPHREWYASVLIPKLVAELRAASGRPHDACHAARCLASLVRACPAFAQRAGEAGGMDALASAEDVGRREYASLARDAENCRGALSCCV